ncbi:asparaginase, partial [Halorubrum tibetense]
GTPGGAVTLADHGVVFASDLPAAKARVGLALGLAAGLSREELPRLFAPK